MDPRFSSETNFWSLNSSSICFPTNSSLRCARWISQCKGEHGYFFHKNTVPHLVGSTQGPFFKTSCINIHFFPKINLIIWNNICWYFFKICVSNECGLLRLFIYAQFTSMYHKAQKYLKNKQDIKCCSIAMWPKSKQTQERMKFSNMGVHTKSVHSKEFHFNVNQNCNAFTYTCGIISNICYECQFFDWLLICIAMI